MKTLVIFDSFFGNTERIAREVGNIFSKEGEVEILRAGEVKQEQITGVDTLILGSPTRGFRPTAALVKLLSGIPARGLAGVKVAAFDTRISIEDTGFRGLPFLMKIFGYAAKPLADRLVKKGGGLLMPPEGFLVKGSEGPLKDGELQRAAGWAKKLKEAI